MIATTKFGPRGKLLFSLCGHCHCIGEGARMALTSASAETNIHLRARAQDTQLIDYAAGLVGANRSQFMMASAIKEAKNALLDQPTLYADAATFQEVMAWMDGEPTSSEVDGMKRILHARTPW